MSMLWLSISLLTVIAPLVTYIKQLWYLRNLSPKSSFKGARILMPLEKILGSCLMQETINYVPLHQNHMCKQPLTGPAKTRLYGQRDSNYKYLIFIGIDYTSYVFGIMVPYQKFEKKLLIYIVCVSPFSKIQPRLFTTCWFILQPSPARPKNFCLQPLSS